MEAETWTPENGQKWAILAGKQAKKG